VPPLLPRPDAPKRRFTPFTLFAGVAAALLAGALALPIAALLLRSEPGALLGRIAQPEVLEALRLSLETSVAATALVIVLGTPLAWVLASRAFPGRRALEVLVQLPMVLPPTVAGVALLLAFGRMGLVGRAFALAGFTLPFTTLGVVVAQAFMSAPFYVLAARAGFLSVDQRRVEAARAARADEGHAFRRIVLPLAAPALAAGTAMTLARALGEFGATITFAGNLPGVTRTLPLAVYLALQTDLDAAITLSVVLLVMSVTLLIVLRAAPGAWPGGSGAPGASR
jgi:molybdate transport system permease protein